MLGFFQPPTRVIDWPENLRAVDRRDFCPDDQKENATLDQPLKSGHFHHSAPHIYALAIDALELRVGLSTLNIGSGSGYFSALIASITGVTGLNHGIEIHSDMVAFSREKTADFLYEFEFLHGSVFNLDCMDPKLQHDRIYVGAGASTPHKAVFLSMLKPEGILVGPFGHEMLKIKKNGKGEVSSEEVLAHVRFLELDDTPPPSPSPPLRFHYDPPWWTPHKHRSALPSFRVGVRCFLCVARRTLCRGGTSNSMGCLPPELLLLIIGFMNRHWFQLPPSEVTILRKQLQEEIKARQRAEKTVDELQDEIRGLRIQLLITNRRRAIERDSAETQTSMSPVDMDFDSEEDVNMEEESNGLTEGSIQLL